MVSEANKAFNTSKDGLGNMNPALVAVKKNLGEIEGTYGQMQNCLSDYDDKLVQVLS